MYQIFRVLKKIPRFQIAVGFLQIQLRTGNLTPDAAMNELQVAEQVHDQDNPDIGDTATPADGLHASGYRGRGRGRARGRGRGRGGRGGHASGRGKGDKDTEDDTYDERCCFHCGLTGHIRVNCPHRKRALQVHGSYPGPPAKRQHTGNAAIAIGDFDNDDDL